MQTTTVVRQSRYGDMAYVIGPDLRRVEDWGLGPVVSCQLLRKAMGLYEDKLPANAVPTYIIGDTAVYVLGRETAEQLKPRSTRPHRMHAICNHCKRHVPTGRFGQHLKVHDEEKAVLRSRVP